MSTHTRERIMEPLEKTSRGYYLLVGLLALGVAWFLLMWVVQLRQGMFVTGLRDWGTMGGVPWGLYIGSFIWWIGIAHGGIMISAAVRVFRVESLRPIARIAELITIVALPMAAANIVFDLGRPDRVYHTIEQWPATVHHSPLAWDVSVVMLYLALSLTYLLFSLREEISTLRDQLPRHFQPIYAVILLGYSKRESEKIEQMTWWLAVAILAIVPLLSGGVVPWLFGLIAAQPGWYGAGTGPAMLVESLTTAFAMVVIVAAAFRYAYGWEDIIDDEVFRTLGIIMVFFTIATLWFLLHDVLVGIYHAPIHVGALTETMVALPLFWVAAALLAIGHVYYLASTLGWTSFSLARFVVVSAGVAVAVLIKKVLFVVEGLMYPTAGPLMNLYPTGTYVPSIVELSVVLGSVATAALLLAIAAKIIPLVEVHETATIPEES